MITSSLSPISVTSSVRSSSTHGESSSLTRVHSAVSPRSISLPTLIRPARAASLRSTGTASSRLPSRMSTFGAMSGTLATIFSFEKSRKWIIREGLNGISRSRLGGADGERLEEVSGVAQVGSPVIVWRVNGTTAGVEANDHQSLPAISRRPMSETHSRRDRPGRARGERRAPLRPLPRGVRGRRRLQALAGQDRHRGRRPPVLPDHDEPPPAAHQRRLRRASPSRGATSSSARSSTRSPSACRVSDVSGKAIANLATEELKHPAPVFHGDTLFCESEVLEKKESQSKPDRGHRQGPHPRAQPGRRAGGRVQAARARAARTPATRRDAPSVRSVRGSWPGAGRPMACCGIRGAIASLIAHGGRFSASRRQYWPRPQRR